MSIGIGLPGFSIGIDMPVYPRLVPVPGHPVYYAPQANSNFFFYDGMYWVYQRDNWYASSWYSGPWSLVGPEAVPVFVLRVPVRYYRQPPTYFRGWHADAPPRWGEHWGNAWEQRRQGWDNWNRSAVYRAAPLPVYQQRYSGSRYPRAEQQQVLHNQNYRYQPQDAVVRQHYQAQREHNAVNPARQARPFAPQQDRRATAPSPNYRPDGGPNAQREPQRPPHGSAPRAEHAPETRGHDPRPQDKTSRRAQEKNAQGGDREQGEQHGGGRNK